MVEPGPAFVRGWQDIISGQRTDGWASACRLGLWGLTPCYRACIAIRNRLFDWGIRSAARVPARVISVGNLTAGGTGKTPTVAWIVRTLQSWKALPAIISRGYAEESGVNDEKLVLDQLLPGVTHVLNPDRVAAARSVLDSDLATCPTHLVLDDAFQHRRIARDVDLVLIDALNPWGHGYLFPRGLLREPVESLWRATAILITRSDLIDEEQRIAIARRIRKTTDAPLFWSQFRPTGLRNSLGQTITLEEAKQRTWGAFCGIGNPDGFRRTLASCGIAITDHRFRTFPDHYHYEVADRKSLGEWARSQGVDGLLATHKDLVKIPECALQGIPLWSLDIELQLSADQADELSALLIGSSADRLIGPVGG